MLGKVDVRRRPIMRPTTVKDNIETGTILSQGNLEIGMIRQSQSLFEVYLQFRCIFEIFSNHLI